MTETDRPTKRVRMDADARRAQILRAAARLFSERPYSMVSVNDIADEVGIAKGLLHHYFGSKRELYLEVVRETAASPLMTVGPAGQPSEGTVEGAFERGVDGLLTLIAQRPEHWLNSVKVGGAEGDDEVASILDESREVVADHTILALGLADQSDDPVLRALVRGYGGFVMELTVEWLGRRRLTREQVRAAMVATLPLLIDQVRPIIDDVGSADDGPR